MSGTLYQISFWAGGEDFSRDVYERPDHGLIIRDTGRDLTFTFGRPDEPSASMEFREFDIVEGELRQLSGQPVPSPLLLRLRFENDRFANKASVVVCAAGSQGGLVR